MQRVRGSGPCCRRRAWRGGRRFAALQSRCIDPPAKLPYYTEGDGRPRFSVVSMREALEPPGATGAPAAAELAGHLSGAAWRRAAEQVQRAAALGEDVMRFAGPMGFAGVSAAAATPPQRERLAPLAARGCILAQENDAAWTGAPGAVQSTASWDAERQALVLHSPAAEAAKRLPPHGSTGGPLHAAVLARLVCADGVDRGPRWVLARLHAEDGSPGEGVSLAGAPRAARFAAAPCELIGPGLDPASGRFIPGEPAGPLADAAVGGTLCEAAALAGVLRAAAGAALTRAAGSRLSGGPELRLQAAQQALLPLAASAAAAALALPRAAAMVSDALGSPAALPEAAATARQLLLYAKRASWRAVAAAPDAAPQIVLPSGPGEAPLAAATAASGERPLAAAVARWRVDAAAARVPSAWALAAGRIVAVTQRVPPGLVRAFVRRRWRVRVDSPSWLRAQLHFREQVLAIRLLCGMQSAVVAGLDPAEWWTREWGDEVHALGQACAENFVLSSAFAAAAAADDSCAQTLTALMVIEGLRAVRADCDFWVGSRWLTPSAVASMRREYREWVADVARDSLDIADALGHAPASAQSA
eukprot:TRINITY_DN3366_c3_g1_i1.p2 TRINITY_DN3366_c3_g1~~TRINITY_DN3366_c3_g1_i1.p2  ORF type:complete len:615 (+),score=211.80 TRINITY_DN3366_c3_g1_i1:81-1847(+)